MGRKKMLYVEEPVSGYESQVVEWKESWRDEYLKWICGFANAQGGRLIIGKNDKGGVIGLANSKKLLADIPNKIRDILGIIADVNLWREDGREYLEIVVDPYPSPVNYRGEYHYRTGSTKQELKGRALDSFLLKKYGLHWDAVPDPHLSSTNFDDQIFRMFVKKGLKCGRLDGPAENDINEQLLANLKLTDGSYFKRAAGLLFSDDPESVAVGAYVKIGFFRTDSDLLYQDEIHGNLFSQVDRTVDLLTTKYMKAYIRYEGVQRIDELLAPKEALREAVTNAIVHKNYASGNPIQISVYEDRVIIWNSAIISDELPIERLLGKHPSIPPNPLLAAAFFRAGYIESWGRGIDKIRNECKSANANEPDIRYDFGGVQVTFTGVVPVTSECSEKTTRKTTTKDHPENSLETTQKTTQKILDILKTKPESSRTELAVLIGNITKEGIKYQLDKMKRLELIRRIGPDKGGHWEVVEKE